MATPEGLNREFEALLEYLKLTRGFDFTAYKRSTLMRRVEKRMQMVGVSGYSSYLDYLQVHPDEFTHLFNTILINVTSFFRDPAAWEYVTGEIIPRIVNSKPKSDHIRLWSAGCASGQEAYTLAIILAEQLGVPQFRERVKIYATDVDEDALGQARQASYSAREVGSLPEELLEKYMERNGTRYCFDKELRRCVIFGRHDLIQDAPISKVDLLVCRNTLMYFNAETQGRILARFHFALGDQGYLFLGKAETLLTHANTFTPVDVKSRVFSKVPKVNLRDRLMVMNQAGGEQAINHLANHVRLRDAAFDAGNPAQLVIDMSGIVVLINEKARTTFNLSGRDVGRPLQDLEISYRPIELRSAVDRVMEDHRPVHFRDVETVLPVGESRFLEVAVAPLADGTGSPIGISITFADVTSYKQLQVELQHFNQELETAYEELQSTNEELQTTNEELQSTVEELETTNEELQSTNEELETMNEELQSTNEELETTNDELARRTDEMNQSNTFLHSILAGLRDTVIVLNPDMEVMAWNHRAEDLWGLRSDEVVGRPFVMLDIGLPVEKLTQAIRACLSGREVFTRTEVEAVNRRGKPISCDTGCTPLIGADTKVCGVIISIIDRDRSQ